jgi:hypothetical protein
MHQATRRPFAALALFFVLATPSAVFADEPTGAAAPDAPAVSPVAATPADATPLDRPVVTIDVRAERLRTEQSDAEGRLLHLDESNEVPDRTLAAEETERVAPVEGLLTHRNQVGIRVGAGIGGILGVRYKSGPDCGTTPGESFCYRAGVPFLDVDLSFGVSGSLEVTALGRIGLTVDDFSQARPMLFGLGVRAYTPKDAVFKVFLGGRVYVDLQDSPLEGREPLDFGVRGDIGLQVDFVRYFGMYLQAGVGLQFVNSFSFLGDASAGLQTRFP